MKEKNNVCACGSTRIACKRNVGWDSWPGGEEIQHAEHCLDCGATRLVRDWVEYPANTGTAYGKWHNRCTVYNIHKKEVKELQEKIERLEAELKEYQEIEVKADRKSLAGEEPF